MKWKAGKIEDYSGKYKRRLHNQAKVAALIFLDFAHELKRLNRLKLDKLTYNTASEKLATTLQPRLVLIFITTVLPIVIIYSRMRSYLT